MQIGERWAYREPPHTPGKPAIPVEVLKFGPKWSRKAHVRWLAGEFPGLDQWVTRDRLIAPWDEIDAVLADEVRYAAVCAASRDAFDIIDLRAAWLTFHAYPRDDAIDLGFFDPRDSGVIVLDDLETICQEFGLDQAFFFANPVAYLDRAGAYVGPWAVALPLAQRVAAVYPDLVLANIGEQEQRLEEDATQSTELPGSSAWAAHLHREQQVFALARAWCGADAGARFDEIEALRAEVARLRRLIDEAARRLVDGGHPRVADRLRNEAGIPPRRRLL